jgi:ubiquinone/menaquinone biosynthesis C-methylase UbiE
MSQMTNFTQPDVDPSFFIAFLEFLDKQEGIRNIRREAQQSMGLTAGQKALDIGCGIGGATFLMAEITGPEGLAAGADISQAMIDTASSRVGGRKGLEFRVADACAVPYANATFDAARSERLFLYLPDRVACVREMKRVVKPGGQVCLLDVDIDATAIYSRDAKRMRKMTSVVADSMPNPNSARELPSIAKQGGLKDIRVKTFALSTPHEFFLRAIASSLLKAAEAGESREEVEACLAEQAELQASGDFFQVWIFAMVTGTV